MTAARRFATAFICLVMAVIVVGSSFARQAPSGLGPEGVSREIDRRSHPAITGAWDAVEHGRWRDPGLASLPSLVGARVLHDGGDWVLVRLTPSQEKDLEMAGVRLSLPRPRPEAEGRAFIPEMADRGGTEAEGDRSLAFLQSLANAVNIDTMTAHLNAISTDLQTRYYRTTQMQRATQYALDHFLSYGCDNAYFDTFTYNGNTIRNVIGLKAGTTYPSRIYMICGHLDSTSPQHDTVAPGAEDNGSGSVGVLEAARLLAPLSSDATIYFVCFTAEEQGMIGSDHLATIAQQQGWDLRGVLNMDMVGYDTPGDPALWIEGFHGNPRSIALMDLIEATANTYTDMQVYRYPGEGWGSDHESFNAHGFPAMLAIDYNWESYPCYHQTCDVITNIVPNQFRRMVLTITLGGAQLAGSSSLLGSIAGTADRTDSQDDAGIRLEIVGTHYDPVLSGPGGVFTIPDLFPGAYTLRASSQGYQTVDKHVTITAGQTTDVVVRLDPAVGGEVRGSVSLQGAGIPLGARVFAEGQPEVAYANAVGAYDLEPVGPGSIVLSANYSGRMPMAQLVTVPSGQLVPNVNFNLKTSWNFESSSEGLTANAGWQWGSDSQPGAHSGTKVWGTVLGANYQNCADYRLDLPPLDLRFYMSARLHFWQWYRTESGHDGGNVQVSMDRGVTWTVATPVGGYPSRMSGNCNALAGASGYGGTQTAWTESIVDLSEYAGRSIRVRLWFASDGGLNDRGWYIDDVSLEGAQTPSGVVLDGAHGQGPDRRALLSDLNVVPNPFSSSATLRFHTASQAAAWITVFDAAGRHIRSLMESVPIGAGDHSLIWDGLDDHGRRVSAGTYWVRVFTSGRTEIKPIVLIR